MNRAGPRSVGAERGARPLHHARTGEHGRVHRYDDDNRTDSSKQKAGDGHAMEHASSVPTMNLAGNPDVDTGELYSF
jgi:hypothetical protein